MITVSSLLFNYLRRLAPKAVIFMHDINRIVFLIETNEIFTKCSEALLLTIYFSFRTINESLLYITLLEYYR